MKIDGSCRVEGTSFPDKSAIEDALDQALIPARLGCVIGERTGGRYSYIDLAPYESRYAIKTVQQVLRAGKITRSSWIQFFDADLGANGSASVPIAAAPDSI